MAQTIDRETGEILRQAQDERAGRRLVTGGDPDALYPVPSVGKFDDGAAVREFIEAPELHQVARALIDHHRDRFFPIAALHIVYLWKRAGGARIGAATLGACGKPTGILKHFAGADFIIWLAADHLRIGRFTAYQVEAIVFHELLHAGIDMLARPALHPHDFEGFRAEIEEYGFWRSDISGIATAVQTRLDLEAAP